MKLEINQFIANELEDLNNKLLLYKNNIFVIYNPKIIYSEKTIKTFWGKTKKKNIIQAELELIGYSEQKGYIGYLNNKNYIENIILFKDLYQLRKDYLKLETSIHKVKDFLKK